MKLLVSGCSFSAGHGFDGPADPSIWPNLLADKLGADVTNVSRNGYDNVGIFLNALPEITSNQYDLILLQLTSLDRIVLSPSIHGSIKVSPNNISPRLSNKDYAQFYRAFLELNKGYEHWVRLLNLIVSVQNLVKSGHNIKFVNGLLAITDDFFTSTSSAFASSIVDAESLPDDILFPALENLNKDKETIDLSLWINPFKSFNDIKIDIVGLSDGHPGEKSQHLFADLIYRELK